MSTLTTTTRWHISQIRPNHIRRFCSRRISPRNLYPSLLLFTLVLVLVFTLYYFLSIDIYDLRYKDYYQKNPLEFRIKNQMEESMAYVQSLVFTYQDPVKNEHLLLQSDYDLLLDSGACDGDKPIDLLIIILSHPKNALRRQVIRNTWLNRKPSYIGVVIKHVFAVGVSDLQHKDLKSENLHHRDIVQHSYIDHKRNLTLKTVSMFRWASKKCTNLKFIAKTDEDIWLNIDPWIDLIKGPDVGTLEKTLFGDCRWSSQAIRWPWNPYHSSFKQLPANRGLGYCHGHGYGLSRKVLNEVVTCSYKEPFNASEDRFVGACVNKTGYRFFEPEIFSLVEYSQVKYNACEKLKDHHIIHGFREVDMKEMWKTLQTC